jgi:hypothetical protein
MRKSLAALIILMLTAVCLFAPEEARAAVFPECWSTVSN